MIILELKQTQWPYGDYALLTIAYGCPETIDHGWTYGYVNITLNGDTSNMLWNDDDPVTFEPHILGPFTQRTLQINFCIMKTSIPRYVNNTEMNKWPTGNYCIFKVGGSCPDGKYNLPTVHLKWEAAVLMVNIIYHI